jgi:hypothetical protein
VRYEAISITVSSISSPALTYNYISMAVLPSGKCYISGTITPFS